MRLQQGFVTGGMGFRVKLHGSNFEPLMSALGQKRTSAHVRPMSALPPKADMGTQPRNVCFVPKADKVHCSKIVRYSITSSARAISDCGTVSPSAFAVLRLIINSYFVGACTGRSAGFSPLRIRST